MVAERENSALAGRLIEETCHKQDVKPQVLTLHSDRGAPMTSKCTFFPVSGRRLAWNSTRARSLVCVRRGRESSSCRCWIHGPARRDRGGGESDAQSSPPRCLRRASLELFGAQLLGQRAATLPRRGVARGGGAREARIARHSAFPGAQRASQWTKANGQPLKWDLPGFAGVSPGFIGLISGSE